MSTRARGAIRVAIVQHDALERDLLRVALDHNTGIEVVGAVADGAELVARAAVLAPDVAVLDVDPRGGNGVPLALKLRRALPDIGVVLLIGDHDSDLLASLPSHGVEEWTYLVQRAHVGLTTLLRAIQVTHAQLLNLSDIEAPPLTALPRLATELPGLTKRQHEVLGLLALGLTNKAIATTLQLKEKTVENQIAAIYHKLDPEADRSRVHPRVWAALRFSQVMRPGGQSSE